MSFIWIPPNLYMYQLTQLAFGTNGVDISVLKIAGAICVC